MAKYFVTTPIYYVNAKPHIGHFYSTLAADVLARWHRKQGDKVLFSTGVDENSQKNVEAAKAKGKAVQEYVDEMAGVWEDTFKQLGLSYDTFIRTTSPGHAAAVHAIIKKLEEKQDIYLGDYTGYYCVGCEEFIPEKDLVDGLCAIHKKEPKKIKEKNYFFKLSSYRDKLLQYYKERPDFVQPQSAMNKMLYYIEHEMEDISISRQAQEWGIRLPNDPSHAVYVWFDALINYLTVTGYPDESFKTFWPADLHIIGKDIIKFHCAIWPAMLMSADLPLPQHVFAHGFFTVNGEKISKSLGNAIDPLELIKEYPIDVIRYYLLRDIPFGNDGDFSHQRLHDRYNADLANGLGNLLSRSLNMIEKFWPDFDPKAQEVVLPVEVTQPLALVDRNIQELAFDKALTNIWTAISWADELIEKTKPWELAKKGEQDELKVILAQLYAVLEGVTTALEPFLPETSVKVAGTLSARPIIKPTEPLFIRKS